MANSLQHGTLSGCVTFNNHENGKDSKLKKNSSLFRIDTYEIVPWGYQFGVTCRGTVGIWGLDDSIETQKHFIKKGITALK